MGLKIAHQGIMIIPLTTNKHKPASSLITHTHGKTVCFTIVNSPSLLLLVVVVVGGGGGVAGDDLAGDVVVVCLDVHVGPLLALPLL